MAHFKRMCEFARDGNKSIHDGAQAMKVMLLGKDLEEKKRARSQFGLEVHRERARLLDYENTHLGEFDKSLENRDPSTKILLVYNRPGDPTGKIVTVLCYLEPPMRNTTGSAILMLGLMSKHLLR